MARRWGVNLVRDAIRDIVGLEEGAPQRYVVMPRSALRQLVDGLGNVEVVLGQSYQPRTRRRATASTSGQDDSSSNGAQAEQLVRHLPTPKTIRIVDCARTWLLLP